MKKSKILIIFLVIVIITIGSFSAIWYNKLLNKPILTLKGSTSYTLYIPSNWDYEDLKNYFIKEELISDIEVFDIMSSIKKYDLKIKPGKYKLAKDINANQLVNKLRSGDQTPVKVTFNNIRFLPKFASKVCQNLEFDSIALMSVLNDKEFIKELGYNEETIISLFLPNTYEFWWNTSPKDFILRMKKEHDNFWDEERIAKANKINLNIVEVNILASIVQEETNKTAEMSRIAGVYINRLKIGMPLQADPTARFAYGDFSVKRVTYDYLKIDSPYNTYMYKGLPPGPICMANPITIDKVLNYETHKYYYFCAKADNSGTHAFASNLRQHNNNANLYHRWLNKQKIYR